MSVAKGTACHSWGSYQGLEGLQHGVQEPGTAERAVGEGVWKAWIAAAAADDLLSEQECGQAAALAASQRALSHIPTGKVNAATRSDD